MIRDSLQDDLFTVISHDAIHAATRRASKRPLNNRIIKLVRCFKGPTRDSHKTCFKGPNVPQVMTSKQKKTHETRQILFVPRRFF